MDALRAFQVRKSAPAIDDHPLGSVKTRAGAERLHPGGNRQIAELLPGGGQDDNSRLRDAVFRGRGNAHGLVRRERQGQVRGGIKDDDWEIRGSQFLREEQAEGLLKHIGIRLVGKPENANWIAARLIGFHKTGEGTDLRAVEAFCGHGQIRESTAARGQRGKSAIVAGKAGAAVADRAFKVLRANARIESQGISHDADVGFGKFFAKTRQHIRVADLRCNVRIDGYVLTASLVISALMKFMRATVAEFLHVCA